jgi:hypothetical protein
MSEEIGDLYAKINQLSDRIERLEKVIAYLMVLLAAGAGPDSPEYARAKGVVFEHRIVDLQKWIDHFTMIEKGRAQQARRDAESEGNRE